MASFDPAARCPRGIVKLAAAGGPTHGRGGPPPSPPPTAPPARFRPPPPTCSAPPPRAPGPGGPPGLVGLSPAANLTVSVELILAQRGVEVSYETIRQWSYRFGQDFANRLRRRRPRPGDKW